ncbi:hypothetical protein CO661_31940 [Sinorhizobium fredii]|uniref:ATPase AAA-type core domain-containing protein n=1 Tax=Rhizobium fredii TaxID=380 RepID=A0A2A6LP10_RHIFR|nr:AAA family ATPase [Sinorhizobium fredii]PDT43976.1 hypothetical protein CO661_31940 [Sinorhizobium fredii]
MTLQISDWRLLKLTLDQVGPFQDAIQTFNFRGIASSEDPDPAPASLYMLLAKNGHGKTTVLESIHGLFGLMANPPIGRFADVAHKGQAQVDIRAEWTIDGKTQTTLLSIWTGSPFYLVDWTDDLESAQVQQWATLNLTQANGVISFGRGTNDLGRLLFEEIRAAQGSAPTELFGLSQELPTVILFPADRRLVAPSEHRVIERPKDWGYQPAQTFASDGPVWSESIDNLLIWLEWLDDGRLAELIAYLNAEIFAEDRKAIRPPRRAELKTFVATPTGEHALEQLSHGERALLQLYARTACHMTRNTILLVDEVDTHLHSKWMNRLLLALKQLLVKNAQLSVIFTTHNRELMKVFDHQAHETGIVKGGYLIEDELS